MRASTLISTSSLLVALLFSAGCYAPDSGSDDPSGCSNDYDCKGPRVCSPSGDCVESGSRDAWGDAASQGDAGPDLFDRDAESQDASRADSEGSDADSGTSPDGDVGECTTPGTSETCDGLDNDCDGETDEELTKDCPRQTGVCDSAVARCSDGTYPSCGSAQYGPNFEANESSCDNLDNDCDGNTDENLTKKCAKQTGVCSNAARSCSDGEYPSCDASDYGSNFEAVESSCDNLDNDCDGRTDENLTRSCGTSTGTCQTGTATCSGGSWGSCRNDVAPSSETCDNRDNDCDGHTDENLTRSCGTSTGTCQTGTETCSGGSWGSCRNDVGPSTETCDNRDNDCDGSTDESLSRTCGTSTGECETGTEYCSSGSWGTCWNEVSPSPETCDNRDNDCDGFTDENVCSTSGTGEPGESCSFDSDCRSGHCDSNTCAHRVFVTSKRYDGDFGGWSGADTTCENLAHAAGLDSGDGDWDPILESSRGNAKTEANISAAVYNMADQKLADDESDFWDGTLDHPVLYTEKGTQASGTGDEKDAWTGFDEAGAAASKGNCNNWSTNASSSKGATGDVHHTDDWADDPYGNDCDIKTRIYCVSD